MVTAYVIHMPRNGLSLDETRKYLLVFGQNTSSTYTSYKYYLNFNATIPVNLPFKDRFIFLDYAMNKITSLSVF